ncbi:MAG: hypothetical protein ACKOYC_02800, partial [Bacteroidota bacterium]
TDQPSQGNFILSPNYPFDWRIPQNDNLWQGVVGTNNPCPAGYRIPTNSEMDAERQTWISNNSVGAFTSPLKLTIAGTRVNSSGSFLDVANIGYYWSSTQSNPLTEILRFGSDAQITSTWRAFGNTIRCIKN